MKHKLAIFGILLIAVGAFATCPIFFGHSDKPAGAPEVLGYDPNPEGTEQFLKSLDKPNLEDKAPHLYQDFGDEEDTILYPYLYKAYHDYSGGLGWTVGRQEIGDCVSWGWAHGVDIANAVRYVRGEIGEWTPAATEAIYGGSRVEARGRTTGGWSDGSYGAAAAAFVTSKGCTGGILLRKNYEDLGFDLTKYSGSRAKNWGNYGCGGQGDNGKADAVAAEHAVMDVALVTDFNGAAAAIKSGYPVPVCSGQGFSSTRDSDGFARAQGSWSHCMVFIGVRYQPRRGLLCLNSWGPNWISGPKYPDDMPDGSFWVEESTANRMLSGRDSFAVSGVKGFPYRKINHTDWLGVTRREEDSYALAP